MPLQLALGRDSFTEALRQGGVMDLFTAATTVMSLIAGKGLDALGAGVGGAVADLAQDAVAKLKGWLISKPDLAPTVKQLEEAPQNPQARAALTEKLQQSMKDDPEIAKVLAQVAEAAAEAGRNGAANNQIVQNFRAAVDKAITIVTNYGTISIS